MAAARKKMIKVTQTGSPIRREQSQRQTLVGLGLNKMHRTVELMDTPETRGMIHKVRHMVEVQDSWKLPPSRRPGRETSESECRHETQ